MVEVSFIKFLTDSFLQAYQTILNSLPENFQILPPLVLFTILISLYSIFIWIFYRFLAQKDLIKLNLNQYNTAEHAFWIKTMAIILYILEFIIILPFVVLFWFSVFSILLLILVKAHTVVNLLLISASLIAAIRIAAYYKEDLAKDLAKIAPFTLLAVALFSEGFFDLSQTLTRLGEIPSVFNHIFYYAFFIILIEIILRLITLVIYFTKSEEQAKKIKK